MLCTHKAAERQQQCRLVGMQRQGGGALQQGASHGGYRTALVGLGTDGKEQEGEMVGRRGGDWCLGGAFAVHNSDMTGWRRKTARRWPLRATRSSPEKQHPELGTSV